MNDTQLRRWYGPALTAIPNHALFQKFGFEVQSHDYDAWADYIQKHVPMDGPTESFARLPLTKHPSLDWVKKPDLTSWPKFSGLNGTIISRFGIRGYIQLHALEKSAPQPVRSYFRNQMINYNTNRILKQTLHSPSMQVFVDGVLSKYSNPIALVGKLEAIVSLEQEVFEFHRPIFLHPLLIEKSLENSALINHETALSMFYKVRTPLLRKQPKSDPSQKSPKKKDYSSRIHQKNGPFRL